MNRNRRLGMERLEDRLALAATPLTFAAAPVPSNVAAVVAPAAIFDPPDPPGGNTTPVVVDPTVPELSPIALPPFIQAPNGTTLVTIPPGGELPSDVPSLAGPAETLSVNAMAAFHTAHPNSQITVTPVIGNKSYAVTVTLRDGDNFAIYHVDETRNFVNVATIVHDGEHNEVVLASELTSGFLGTALQLRFDNGDLSSALWAREFNGQATVSQFPEASAASAVVSKSAAAKSSTSASAVAQKALVTTADQVVKPFTKKELKGLKKFWEPLITKFVKSFNKSKLKVDSIVNGLQQAGR